MIATMTRPFLICLGQIPQAVLSGLFFIMGIQGLIDNTIISRILWLFIDPIVKNNETPPNTLSHISLKSFLLFITLSLAGFVGEFAITNTIAAIGFPLVLLLTVIVSFIFPKIFSKEELDILDPPVAQRFTIKNLLFENLCNDSSSSSIDENDSLSYNIQESAFSYNLSSMDEQNVINMTMGSTSSNTYNNHEIFNNNNSNNISPESLLDGSSNSKSTSSISKTHVNLNIHRL